MTVTIRAVKLQAAYAQALGLAMWCFAGVESNVGFCCEFLHPGSRAKFTRKKFTAGDIAEKFKQRVRNMKKCQERQKLDQLALEFERLVKLRNEIAHGAPCMHNSKHVLQGRATGFIGLDRLADAADQFHNCNNAILRILDGFLKTYDPKPPKRRG